MAKLFKYADIVNKHGKPIYQQNASKGNNELEKHISYLDDLKVKYKKFEMKDKNNDDITVIIEQDKHSFSEASDWMINVFNSSNEKIISDSATTNCDYEFDKKYNIFLVENILKNLDIL